MGITPTLRGNVISRVNGIGSDATPKRCVVLDASNPDKFKLPAGVGVLALGVLLRDLRFEDGVTPNGKAGSIQIDGIVDIECGGAITAWHFVKIKDTTGKIIDAGAVDGLSDGATQKNIIGVALEVGEDGSDIAVWLKPQVCFLA